MHRRIKDTPPHSSLEYAGYAEVVRDDDVGSLAPSSSRSTSLRRGKSKRRGDLTILLPSYVISLYSTLKHFVFFLRFSFLLELTFECLCAAPLNSLETIDSRKYEDVAVNTEDNDKEIDYLPESFQFMSLHREPGKREFSREKYPHRRQEKKSIVAKLEKQLKARSELEVLIEEQLNRFDAQYNKAMVPGKLKDVAEILMPKSSPPLELASLTWMGDWRPSALLNLLLGLVDSSSSSPSSSTCFADSIRIQKLLPQLMHEISIEEAIIDEQMAEIQATCVLHLPFLQADSQSGDAALPCIESEFMKISHVITRAQQLRFKVLEMILKKLLNLTDAAEFLVAFEGIGDLIHPISAHHKVQKGSVTVAVRGLGSY